MSDKASKDKTIQLSDLFTAPAAAKGKRVDLTLPDGTPTEYYLTVMGSEAHEARRSRMDSVRRFRDGVSSDSSEEDRDSILELADLDFRCALVIGGNLPGGFSAEAVRELLHNTPSLADRVEAISSSPALFFGSAPGS